MAENVSSSPDHASEPQVLAVAKASQLVVESSDSAAATLGGAENRANAMAKRLIAAVVTNVCMALFLVLPDGGRPRRFRPLSSLRR